MQVLRYKVKAAGIANDYILHDTDDSITAYAIDVPVNFSGKPVLMQYAFAEIDL